MNASSFFRTLVPGTFFAALAGAAVHAQTVSPVQAKVQPFGLPLAGPVMLGGSDAASKAFQAEGLPSVMKLLNGQLSEYKRVNDAGMLLDPSKLLLKTTSDVRVYFVGEGAGFRNTLGYNATGVALKGGDPTLIFPDATSPVGTSLPNGNVKRTAKEPLLPGDFVDLGQFAGGTKLDFFLIADGANGGRNVFSTTKAANPDGINHVVSFVTVYSTYLLIGFEDLYGGGDRDFNDLLFAVDIGAVNIAALTATPEPATVLILGGMVLGVGLAIRHQRRPA
jgi:hypothetical protein